MGGGASRHKVTDKDIVTNTFVGVIGSLASKGLLSRRPYTKTWGNMFYIVRERISTPFDFEPALISYNLESFT